MTSSKQSRTLIRLSATAASIAMLSLAATGAARADDPGKLLKGIGAGFYEDVKIWLNKAPIDNPLLCEEDGPVYQLRRWYSQFYVDVADITPEMSQRFEFEIDTTKAVDFWQKELVEKAAQQA